MTETDFEVREVVLSQIKDDRATQIREKLSADAITEYTRLIGHGLKDKFPPIELMQTPEGDLYITDGWHRFMAMKRCRYTTVEAVIRKGTRRDAIDRAAQANHSHGVRRDNSTKRNAIMVYLCDREWRKLNDRDIAARAGVSHTMVANWRRRLDEGIQADAVTHDAWLTNRQRYGPVSAEEENEALSPRASDNPDGPYAPSVQFGETDNGSCEHESDFMDADAREPDVSRQPLYPYETMSDDPRVVALSDWVRDAFGNVIRDPKIAAVFVSGKWLREMCTRMRMFRTMLTDMPPDLPVFITKKTLDIELKNAEAHMRNGVPHALCPACDSGTMAGETKCRHCKGSGWLGRERYALLPDALKWTEAKK